MFLPTEIYLGWEEMSSLAMERISDNRVEKYHCYVASVCEIHSNLTAKDHFPEFPERGFHLARKAT